MRTIWTSRTAIAGAAVLAALSSGCAGDLATQGRSPVQLIVNSLTASAGETDTFGGDLRSDVLTDGGIFNDVGEATLSLILKDPGNFGNAAPTALNRVTINRYRVVYRRTDGRNTPGVHVPYGFDSAITVTVPEDGTATAGFQIVRHAAKAEAPLAALASTGDIISTIAEVTFFGFDQAGNEISATGNIGIDFGNFADPD